MHSKTQVLAEALETAFSRNPGDGRAAFRELLSLSNLPADRLQRMEAQVFLFGAGAPPAGDLDEALSRSGITQAATQLADNVREVVPLLAALRDELNALNMLKAATPAPPPEAPEKKPEHDKPKHEKSHR